LYTTIAAILQWANQQLISASDTPRLDAEVLLAYILEVSRSYLLAFPERLLSDAEMSSFKKLLEQRKQNIPIAYITGHREFWSLDIRVTPDTLIPRPETELLVEHVLKQLPDMPQVIADLGTGSGAIALAIAHERPAWEIYATDISTNALQIAEKNAARLRFPNILFVEGNWCNALPQIKFDAIISNPPYIAQGDPYLQQNTVHYEPASALMAKENGLGDIRQIIQGATSYLRPKGYLLLEHGFLQAGAVQERLAKWGYTEIHTYQDIAARDRVTCGRRGL